MYWLVVTTGDTRCAKHQSNSHHHHLFYRPDALPVAQPTTEGKEERIPED